MKHVGTIEILIQTLVKSDLFHALVVQSPPGWSKSTTIESVLNRMDLPFLAVGSYTTPLHFYNTLSENPDSIIVLDDCAGLFSDQKTMSILKAATWASSAGGGKDGGSRQSKARRIAWGSTSDKVAAPQFDFSGKIILLTNVLPQGKEVQAFLSRCLSLPLAFSEAEIKRMILDAARSTEYFGDSALAQEVANFIVHSDAGIDFSQVNLRTLRMGYELATTQPESWRLVLPHLLPRGATQAPTASATLIDPGLSPKAQEREFMNRTGKSRRTFYLHKKRMGLTRPYRSKRLDKAKDSGVSST